ncbi:MAG: G1 family glutamic endopeptidase [Actinomycetales bacterium]
MRRVSLVVAALAVGSSALPLASTAAAVAPVISHRPAIHAAKASGSTGWASSNWSGYAKTGSGYTSATAQWVVPSVQSSRGATYSSAWVGIDGFNNSSLIQTGTESDYYNGSPHYNAWWEILPAAETPIPSISVRPGDHMTASIAKGSGSSWTITITDASNGGSFTTQQSYTGPGTSVEWIEEAPSIGGRVATLAHYSSPDTFDSGTVNGANPLLGASDGGVMIQKRVQVSTPSLPDGDNDGFNMAYGASVPQPPAS